MHVLLDLEPMNKVETDAINQNVFVYKYQLHPFQMLYWTGSRTSTFYPFTSPSISKQRSAGLES